MSRDAEDRAAAAKESTGRRIIRRHMESIGALRLAEVEAPDGGTLTYWNSTERVYIVQEYAGKQGCDVYRCLDGNSWATTLREIT